MNKLCLVENEPAVLELEPDAASALRATGQQMSSSAGWWGNRAVAERGSVIDLISVGTDRYRVVFRDVVGVIQVKGQQIEVLPKIPLEHFLYLAARGMVGARYQELDVSVAQSPRLVDVLAEWFVRAAERLLNQGLRADYRAHRDELPAARGEILICETTMAMLSGRGVVHCRFDERSEDTPLNRVVKAACLSVAANDVLPAALSARARRVASHFADVGPMQTTDVRTQVDRTNVSYARAFSLALLVLQGMGLSSASGRHRGAAFLIRTPELIEDGLRAVIQAALPETSVTKRRFLLGNTGLSMNPDLVFGNNEAVGDVKYRYLQRDWHRADLNQVVAFAAVARCLDGLLVGFTIDASSSLPRGVPVGDVRARCIAWTADARVSIDENLEHISTTLKLWWSGLGQCT